MPPTDVNIISQRFSETTWSDKALIREETYQLENGSSSHWFYLPKEQDWAVINGHAPLTPADHRLADFVNHRIGGSGQAIFVGMRDGDLIIPDAEVIQSHSNLPEGQVQVFLMEDLKDSKSLEDSSANE
jgi:hypothetical protein